MTTEELTQENVKLQGRIEKATQVFREQKKELDELKKELADKDAKIKLLEEKACKVDENNELFMKQEEEIAALKQKVNEQAETLKENADKIGRLSEELQGKDADIASLNDTINSHRKYINGIASQIESFAKSLNDMGAKIMSDNSAF